MNDFIETQKGIKVIESLENYSLLPDFFFKSDLSREQSANIVYDEAYFWHHMLQGSKEFTDGAISLYHFTLCSWVARIPGLYWTEQSTELRKVDASEVSFKSQSWTEFHPTGKSRKVLGGIGTLLLPQDRFGNRMVTLSSSNNASTGIPALISEEVYECLSLNEGDVLNINAANWSARGSEWSQLFASTKDIPSGYLVISKAEQIQKVGAGSPVAFHPFSIMEYESKSALLYDYVYLSVDSHHDSLRSTVENFFNDYARKEGRNGRYLINPNLVNPFFETRYQHPSQLSTTTERAHLELIKKRIVDDKFGKTTLNKVIQAIPAYYESINSLTRLIKFINVNPALFNNDTVVGLSAQLVNYCLDNDKIHLLFDRITYEYPIILNN